MPDQTVLAVLVGVWVILLPPGSLFFQAGLRLLLILLWVAMVSVGLTSMDFFYGTGRAVMAGFSGGVFIRLFVFRRQPDRLFCAAMIPRVLECEKFFVNVMQYWSRGQQGNADNKSLEPLWLFHPKWVNVTGFDRRLQPGYQFFIRRLAEVGDVLFSLRHLTRTCEPGGSPAYLQGGFADCTSAIQQIFSGIVSALRQETDRPAVQDFSDSLIRLEKEIRQHIPRGGGWDENCQDWMLFADVVCCLEDLRWLLLKLNEASNFRAGRFPRAAPLRGPLSPPAVDDLSPTLPMNHHKASGPGAKHSPE